MKQGQIRIIGGVWRGRKLSVPDVPNLRPTPDRVRETLFNWLAPVIEGAYCLDAFAGSGVLGFEALSRGAAHVVMVEQASAVVTLLQKEVVKLQALNTEIYCAKTPQQLRSPLKLFDIVFLDPPYQDNILLPTCFYLEEQGFLAKEAYIYLEAKDLLQQNELPAHWQLLKNKKAGQVFYHLARRCCYTTGHSD
ncbi:MAG: rsmD [Gammaproteobacteria bacterium]|jgi:16S rRNA (guanine966-N2)-methyltransferase|nr:rsmD [Gammaproteobacteria bacterium]